MRVPGYVAHHARDGEIPCIQRYGLTEGGCVAEVLARYRLGDHNRPRIAQRLFGIALHHWKSKYAEEIGVRPEHAVFEKRLILVAYDPTARRRTEADKGLNLRHEPLQGGAEGGRRFGIGPVHDAIDTIRVRVVPVVLAFVLYVESDEDRAGYADGQVQGIEHRVVFIPEQMSGAYREVVFQQCATPSISKITAVLFAFILFIGCSVGATRMTPLFEINHHGHKFSGRCGLLGRLIWTNLNRQTIR